jgi:hypothetical protein
MCCFMASFLDETGSAEYEHSLTDGKPIIEGLEPVLWPVK